MSSLPSTRNEVSRNSYSAEHAGFAIELNTNSVYDTGGDDERRWHTLQFPMRYGPLDATRMQRELIDYVSSRAPTLLALSVCWISE